MGYIKSDVSEGYGIKRFVSVRKEHCSISLSGTSKNNNKNLFYNKFIALKEKRNKV